MDRLLKAMSFYMGIQEPEQIGVGSPGASFDTVSVLKMPRFWEIALKLRGEIVYSPDIGYDDVCRFETRAEVDIEIERLRRIAAEEAASASPALEAGTGSGCISEAGTGGGTGAAPES
jgi:hypothetical protein